MPGYPGDPFGDDPFGVANWSRKAIYESLPQLHRLVDEKDKASILKRWFGAYQSELEGVRQGIVEYPYQRDPLVARGGEGSPPVAIASSVVGDPTLIVTSTPHGFEGGEIVTFAGCNDYGVFGSHKIEVVDDLSFTIPVATTVVIAGPLSVVQIKQPESCTVTVESVEMVKDKDYGMMAQFTLAPGTDISSIGVGCKAKTVWFGPAPDFNRYTFTHTVSRIHGRLSSDPSESSYVQCAAEEFPNVGNEPGFMTNESIPLPYNMTFVRPGTLKALTSDFGITFDANDPEFMQRSTIQNVVKYIEKKGSRKGYEIRASTMGFDVDVEGMWSLCDDYELLPSSSKIVDGDSVYTTVAPMFPRFDEIAADVKFTDPSTGVTDAVMDSILYSDGSADGMSPVLAWSMCTDQVTLISETVLPAGTGGFENSRSVLVDWGAADRSEYGDMGTGAFALVDPVSERPVWIESETYDAAMNRSVMVISVPPDFAPLSAGDHCILYAPDVDKDSCCWCRTHLISIICTPTPELVAGYNGDGTLISEALDRLVPRLIAEQVPIHVEIARIALGVRIEVAVPKFGVSVEKEESYVIRVPFMTYYDEVPADEAVTDDGLPTVSITVTETP